MDNLITFTEEILTLAAGSCNACLIAELADENSEIADSITRLQVAHESFGRSPEHDDEFADALADFLTRVITMAMFTGELMHRPGVRWLDENRETTLPIVISAN